MSPTRRKEIAERLLAGMASWPQHWQIEEGDAVMGSRIVATLEEFLTDLAGRGGSESTLRRHFGNAFVLGNAIIREAQNDPELRLLDGRELLLLFVDEEGGPLLEDSENEQRSFDATCRRIASFFASER